MSDWDFLHEMRDEGHSPDDIADAAASGASPREWGYIAKQETKMELEELEQLRDSERISPGELKKRKSKILGY